jgi:hypothetical protein
MKKIAAKFLVVFFALLLRAVSEPLPVPEASRTPIDYERAFNAAHWQFSLVDRDLDSVYVTLFLEGREVVSTFLTEQHAHSLQPYIFDVVLSPILADSKQRDWHLRIHLREHAALTRSCPRPEIGGDTWEAQSPAFRIAPNRYELGRFYNHAEPKKQQRLVLTITTNKH